MQKLFIFVQMLILSTALSAKDLYVDGDSGDDATLYADNGPSSPWATIGRAAWGSTDRDSPNPAEAAQAGDSVFVDAGIYEAQVVTNSRNIPVWNPVNNGTPGSPITFSAAGQVVLRSIPAAGIGNGGPVIGAYERSFITWDGFFVDEENIETVPDTGPVVIWASDNIIIENLEIAGKTVFTWTGDNHNGIRVEGSDSFIIRGNTIYGISRDDTGVGGDPTSHNATAITTYESSNGLIENNVIFDIDNGIFLKGNNPGPFVVRGNNVYNTAHYGFHMNQVNFQGSVPSGPTGDGSNPVYVYRNAFHNNNIGIFAQPATNHISGFAIKDIYIVNNTLYNNEAGIMFRPDIFLYNNVVIRNNIIDGAPQGSYFFEDADFSPFSYDYNLINNSPCVASHPADNCASLSEWRALSGGQDLNTVTGDPMFMDAANHDFRLLAGSPAEDAGIDILDLNGNGTAAAINIGADLNASAGSVSIPPTIGGGGGSTSGGGSSGSATSIGPSGIVMLLALFGLRLVRRQ